MPFRLPVNRLSPAIIRQSSSILDAIIDKALMAPSFFLSDREFSTNILTSSLLLSYSHFLKLKPNLILVDITISLMPSSSILSTTYSIIGFPAIGRSGLGLSSVKGQSLFAYPPAKIRAFRLL
jgi:hypothetical protein